MASIKDCKKIQGLLGDYIDGALTAEAAWNTKLHLASCAVCARAVEELQGTVSLMQGLPRLETSETFEKALARRLSDTALQPRRSSFGERLREWWSLPRVRPVLAAAGTFAALVPAAFFVYTRQVGPPPGAPTPVGQQFVQECLEEHMAYVASEPLGDQSAVFLASSLDGFDNYSSEERP